MADALTNKEDFPAPDGFFEGSIITMSKLLKEIYEFIKNRKNGFFSINLIKWIFKKSFLII
mgnify:CR=1 FL=1